MAGRAAGTPVELAGGIVALGGAAAPAEAAGSAEEVESYQIQPIFNL